MQIFADLVAQDIPRRVELITRLHVLVQYLPAAAPHFAHLLLNYVMGMIHHTRVALPDGLVDVLNVSLPLLAAYVPLLLESRGAVVLTSHIFVFLSIGTGLSRAFLASQRWQWNAVQAAISCSRSPTIFSRFVFHRQPSQLSSSPHLSSQEEGSITLTIDVARIHLLHAALLASPHEATDLREIARPCFLQPAGKMPDVITRTWLRFASDLFAYLEGGAAHELDSFLHGIAVLIETKTTHRAILRSSLALCLDASRRFVPYFKDFGGFGLVLTHMIRAYQLHYDDPLIRNGTVSPSTCLCYSSDRLVGIENTWFGFVVAHGEVFVLHAIACLCPSVLRSTRSVYLDAALQIPEVAAQPTVPFQADPNVLFALVLALAIHPSEDDLRIQDACRIVSSSAYTRTRSRHPLGN